MYFNELVIVCAAVTHGVPRISLLHTVLLAIFRNRMLLRYGNIVASTKPVGKTVSSAEQRFRVRLHYRIQEMRVDN